MARRLPGTPPVLPGYTHVRALGTGGFADVFLYEQSMPRRSIAVKVLIVDAVQGDVRAAFLRETNTLAQLSSHPHVLTMYEAGIAADGRPYLVTEYCPSGYGERFRTETIPVTEVLSVGLGIGAALHTAHASGVLHRDLKPANVLLTSFSRPVLADFGIAATLEHATAPDQEEIGLSVPWAAPELLEAGCGGSVAAEIYSFGALMYGLLAGRSPYEVSEGRNDRASLARRIVGRTAPAPIGRDDVPPALAALIASCLQRRPERRPADMLEVLHRLQLAETELGLRPTGLELAAPAAAAALPAAPVGAEAVAGHAGTTTGRLAGLGSTGVGSSGAAGASGSSGGAARRTAGRRGARGSASAGFDDATRRRPLMDTTAEPGSRRRAALLASAAAAVAVVAVLAWWRPWTAHAPVVDAVAAVSEQGAVRFTWQAPRGGADEYEVQVQGRPAVQQPQAEYRVETAQAGERVCVTVAVVRDGRVGVTSEPRCARSQEAH